MCLESVVAALAVAGMGGAHRPLRARREQEVTWNFFDALKFSRDLEEGMEDVSLLERFPHFRGWYVKASMELGPEDVSLLERCPHFRGWYVQASMELEPEDVRGVLVSEGGMYSLTCKQGTVARLRSKAPVTSSPTLYDGLKNDNLPMTPLGFFSV